MSILVYTENWEGKFRKSIYEAISYSKKIADKFGEKVVALSIGDVKIKFIALSSFSLEKFRLTPIIKENINVIHVNPGKISFMLENVGLNANEKINIIDNPKIIMDKIASLFFNS